MTLPGLRFDGTTLAPPATLANVRVWPRPFRRRGGDADAERCHGAAGAGRFLISHHARSTG